MVTTRISTEDSINMCGCVLGIQLPANVYLDTLQCSHIKKNHFNVFIVQECLNIHCCHHAVHILHSEISSAAIWKQFPLVVVLVGFVSLLIKELKQLLFSVELCLVLCLLKKLYMATSIFCYFHSSWFRSFRPFCKLGKDNSTNLASIWEPPTLSSKQHNCFHSN